MSDLNKKSNGGHARARNLSDEGRAQIAKKAADTRWAVVTEQAPTVQKAMWGAPEKLLKIGNVQVECYVLENKTRVLSGRGMQQAIGLGGEANTHGGKLRDFLMLETIKPFVSNDLAMAVNGPLLRR